MVGLKYFNDFQQRIARDEATEISETVQEAVKTLFGDKTSVVTCGSYRRGRATCGDVDILITRTDNKLTTGMLEKLVTHLESTGFLKERLALSNVDSK